MLTHRERAEQLISDPTFEVGNHTWTHRNLRSLGEDAIGDEVASTELAYERIREGLVFKQCVGLDPPRLAGEIAPKRLNLFRFPFGSCDKNALEAVNEMGLLSIQWDVSSGDSAGTASGKMKSALLSEIHPGSIVLFHANGRGRHTSDVVPELVSALRAQGYEFATVSELLEEGRPIIANTRFNLKPGDTDKYDTHTRH